MLRTCFIQLLWFVLVFQAITNDVFDVGMPISGKTKEQGIWQVIFLELPRYIDILGVFLSSFVMINLKNKST